VDFTLFLIINKMHSSMKSIESKMQLCTKNNSIYVSMKVSFMVVKVIWFHNKKNNIW
jgi:hypothetical protein